MTPAACISCIPCRSDKRRAATSAACLTGNQHILSLLKPSQDGGETVQQGNGKTHVPMLITIDALMAI